MCPRQIRYISDIDTYHILINGVDNIKLFPEKEDKNLYLNILSQKMENGAYLLYAYCILDSHAHLLLKENNMPLSYSMQRINTAYAGYFNKKYKRNGAVFDGRYKSEAINTEEELNSVIEFIHQNPKLHGYNIDSDKYQYSSYKDYIKNGRAKDILDPFEEIFRKMTMGLDACFDMYMEDCIKSQEDLTLNIIKLYTSRNRIDINELSKGMYYEHKKRLILFLRNNTGFSIRKISDLLNLNRGVVYKIISEQEESGGD